MAGRLATIKTAGPYTIPSTLGPGMEISIENQHPSNTYTISPPGGLTWKGGGSVGLPPGRTLVAVNVAGAYVHPYIFDGVSDLLIPNNANTVAHVYWNEDGIQDMYGNAWAMQGTVPVNAADWPRPPCAGPFSDANYYQLGSGTDVLDFATQFNVYVVFAPLFGISYGSGPYLMDDGSTASLSGWASTFDGSAHHGLFSYADSANAVTTNTVVSNSINVVCFGRSGNNLFTRLNLTNPGSAGSVGYAAGPTMPARIGRGSNVTGRAWPGLIYEIMADTGGADDNAWAAAVNRVKARLGITAW